MQVNSTPAPVAVTPKATTVTQAVAQEAPKPNPAPEARQTAAALAK